MLTTHRRLTAKDMEKILMLVTQTRINIQDLTNFVLKSLPIQWNIIQVRSLASY